MDDFRGVCGPVNPLMTVLHNHMKDYIVPVAPIPQTTTLSWWKWTDPPVKPPSRCPGNPKVNPREDPMKPTTPLVVPVTPPTDATCNDQMFTVHEDCTKYYQCVHGQWVAETCKDGTIWDPVNKVCNWRATTRRTDNCRFF